MKTISLGRHLLLEYFGCDRNIINNKELIREALLEAARRANATIVTDVFHTFNPHGVSGVVVIAESHIAVHTWPEHGCVAVDIFSCSNKMKPEVIEGFLKDVFKATDTVCIELERGKLSEGLRMLESVNVTADKSVHRKIKSLHIATLL